MDPTDPGSGGESLTAVQVQMRGRLVEALKRDLIGPMVDDEVLRDPPSRWYLTGFLVPRGASEQQRFDPTATEELDAGVDGTEDDDRGDAVRPATRPFLPSSYGMSVLVPPQTDVLEIKAEWGRYEPVPEEEVAELLDRKPAEDGASDTEERLPQLWRRRFQDPPLIRVPIREGRHELPETDGVYIHVVAGAAPTVPGIPQGTKAVSIFLVNEQTPIEGSEADRQSLFQVAMRVICPQGFVPRSRLQAAGHPDDQRDDLQYRNHREWAVGHGVATTALEVDEAVREVATCWLPEARVYRMKAEAHGALLDMEKLAELDGEALYTALGPMLDAYRDTWIEPQRALVATLRTERQPTATRLLEQAEQALSRIRRGLEYLRDNTAALQAFQLANSAMALAARRVRPDETPSWRLFQLAFVLLNVRGVADSADPDRPIADLLFFPTGGGKTEAYLGVAAFAMLLRRLQHVEERHEGAGVTVILRYTLRLLTLDQLKRASTLTCALELLRQAAPEKLGRRRFSVGLWVGRKATANTLEEAGKNLNAYRMRPNDPRRAPPVPLVGCPWCGTPFVPESFQQAKDGRRVSEIRVGCDNVECEYSYGRNARGLPIVVVDEQLYRELPAFLIATVDKFAALPWRGAMGSLFGKVTACDDQGFYGQHEPEPKTARKLHHGLPPPTLILQDELHLITGPLGTMVGLFETAIDHLCRDAAGHRPKVIASTATARRASEQIRALYGRSRMQLFPPQGLNDGDTFFATRDEAEEKTRLYVGVAAPGRSSKAILARVGTTLLGATYRLWSARAAGSDNPADTYMTLVAYFNSLHELGGAQRLFLEEVAPRVARIDLRRPVGQERSDFLSRRNLGYDILELTSRQSTAEIRNATGRLREYFSVEEGRRTDVLLASSMISVGVDISRLGLMVVNGQPRTVAEYIQASSRVGRESPGLVVTLYNLFKPRDRSHYERFVAFHECFYRHVESASVTPFSGRAVERGLAGLTVGLARHLDRGLAHPGGAEHIERSSAVGSVAEIVASRASTHRSEVADQLPESLRVRVRGLVEDWGDIARTMSSESAPLSYSSWEKRRGSTPLMSTAVDRPNDRHDAFEHFRAPTSMRDVEPSVHFWVNRSTKHNKRGDK